MAGPTVAAKTEHWSSRAGFILASVGAAVGLGNFWRFPYMAGENGGGAFVLVYLICVLLVATPLAMMELMIGRRGQRSAIASSEKVATDLGLSSKWSVIGWMGTIATFLIGTFYCVVGGWVIFYIGQSLGGGFSPDPAANGKVLDDLFADPGTLIVCQILFITMSVMIPARGIKGGVEKAANILMPALLAMMVGLVIYAMFTGSFGSAATFLFSVDLSKITPQVILDAIGQAFFSVGIGMAILITYGAYLQKDTNIPQSAAIISLSDTGVAILAGLVIFPIVFANGLDPAAGPGLVFVTLPTAFGQMVGGGLIGTVFFVLLLFAALTSSIGIVEISVSYLEERNISRRLASWLVGAGLFVLGLGSVFSFNLWADFYPLGFIPMFDGLNWFDTIDFITGQFMLTTGGLLIAVFGGWYVSSKETGEEFGWPTDHFLFRLWQGLMRILIPLLIGLLVIVKIYQSW